MSEVSKVDPRKQQLLNDILLGIREIRLTDHCLDLQKVNKMLSRDFAHKLQLKELCYAELCDYLLKIINLDL